MITQASFMVTLSGLELCSEYELEQLRQTVEVLCSNVAAGYRCALSTKIHNIKGVLIHDPPSE